MLKSFRDLMVWQKAMKFVTAIYILLKKFPKEENYGLSAQIRRSSVSIPCNIAEGFGRKSLKDYIRFLEIAAGSLFEIQTQIEIAFNLKYLGKNDFNNIYDDSREIERMITSLIRKLRAKD